MHLLQTPRLLLRQWQEQDIAPFAAMNADLLVMRHFPAPLTTQESNAYLDRIRAEFTREPFGLWAIERREDGRMIGYTGLHRIAFDGPLHGQVEIGWRLCSDCWGKGYAPEAARACLDYAHTLGLGEIVSFTTLDNLPSQRVMQKIGMHSRGEFDHPALPADHPMLRHVLYAIEP